MNKILLVLLTIFNFVNINAQSSLEVNLNSTSYFSVSEIGKFSISDNSIKAILESYPNVKYELAYPGAEKINHPLAKKLSKVIKIEAKSNSVLYNISNDLNNLSSKVSKVQILEPVLLSDPVHTNDPKDEEWNDTRHEMMCVREAWCHTTGSPNILIAITDNGYDMTNPDLIDKVDFIEPGADTGACHGTASAIAAAGGTDNGYGLSASGFNCRLLLYRDLNTNDFIDAANRGARVINCSWGRCNYNQNAQDVINLVTDMGVTVVAAAGNGNHGNNCNLHDPMYPASYDNVISISGVSSTRCIETTWHCDGTGPLRFATHNDQVVFLAQSLCVDSGTCMTDNQGNPVEFVFSNGTSIASPQVAGVIGLILSVNPCLNHTDIMDILASTDQDVSDECNNQDYYPNGEVPGIPCAEDAVLLAQSFVGEDIIVSQNETWDQRFVSGNVYVTSGGTLTVTGIVSFAQNSMLYVEQGSILNIDGGLLTSCDTEWQGVRAEGSLFNGNSALITLTNQGTIENARTAISDNVGIGRGGMIVNSNNGLFIDNRRGIEFVNTKLDNQSRLVNTTFSNGINAVTIWASNGVYFENTTFDDFTQHGILSEDAAITVESCEFLNNEEAIKVVKSFPNRQIITVANSEFSNNEIDIFSTGASTGLFDINTNVFRGNDHGIYLDGDNAYRIADNDFEDCEIGNLMLSNGGASNAFSSNLVAGSLIGTYPVYNNSGFRFLDNCYQNSGFSDVYVNGVINQSQGNDNVGAGNCFSNTATGINTLNSSSVIDYYIPTNNTDPCVEPTIVGNQYNPLNSIDINNRTCGTGNPVTSDETYCNLGPFNTDLELITEIKRITLKIMEIEQSNLPQ